MVQVAAVMGPSGAGKTTFLNALMGTVKYGTISGQVWVNGRAMKMSRLRRIMGFVPQVLQQHQCLLWRALPCPARPCPARPCPALPCPALPPDLLGFDLLVACCDRLEHVKQA